MSVAFRSKSQWDAPAGGVREQGNGTLDRDSDPSGDEDLVENDDMGVKEKD
jgi:hypothetical protein